MSKITEHSEWERDCPECGDTLYYSTKRYRNRADDSESVCRSCRKMPDSQKQKLSEYWTGKSRPNYPKTRRKQSEKTDWERNCPDCGNVLYYSTKGHMKEAIRKETVCDSCANYKYKKTFNDIITPEHIKQMRATKAGFTNWEEYLSRYPKKKQYQLEIRRQTRQQPLHELKDFDLWDEGKGLNGVDGALQLDHIVSIDSGWAQGIPPEYIAHISNLRIITWQENISKGSGELLGKALLCSAFPGTGKTYFYEASDKLVLDSDSSKFDKGYFPENYIQHIKDNASRADVICISSHKEVRDALVENGLEFKLIYPDRSLKEHYIDRYKQRGSPSEFIDLVETNWDNWMDEMENQGGCEHIVLQKDQFVSDVMGKFVKKSENAERSREVDFTDARVFAGIDHFMDILSDDEKELARHSANAIKEKE